jgi:hypothetical protein
MAYPFLVEAFAEPELYSSSICQMFGNMPSTLTSPTSCPGNRHFGEANGSLDISIQVAIHDGNPSTSREPSLIALCKITLLKQPDSCQRLYEFTIDVYNVTEQYTQLIGRQKQMLMEAKRRQGQRPRDWKSREEAYGNFMIALYLAPHP